jgi:hypothetical protein
LKKTCLLIQFNIPLIKITIWAISRLSAWFIAKKGDNVRSKESSYYDKYKPPKTNNRSSRARNFSTKRARNNKMRMKTENLKKKKIQRNNQLRTFALFLGQSVSSKRMFVSCTYYWLMLPSSSFVLSKRGLIEISYCSILPRVWKHVLPRLNVFTVNKWIYSHDSLVSFVFLAIIQ